MSPNPCAVLTARERDGRVYFEPCGASSRYVIKIGGDSLFSACHRHNGRLERAGVTDDPVISYPDTAREVAGG